MIASRGKHKSNSVDGGWSCSCWLQAAATAQAARPIASDVAEMRFGCEAPGGALIASLAAPKTEHSPEPDAPQMHPLARVGGLSARQRLDSNPQVFRDFPTMELAGLEPATS